jgi:hypothetical protein
MTSRDGSENALTISSILLNVFLTLGTAYNIIVYSFFNRHFRKGLVKGLTRCGQKKNSADQPPGEQSVSQISGSKINPCD